MIVFFLSCLCESRTSCFLLNIPLQRDNCCVSVPDCHYDFRQCNNAIAEVLVLHPLHVWILHGKHPKDFLLYYAMLQVSVTVDRYLMPPTPLQLIARYLARPRRLTLYKKVCIQSLDSYFADLSNTQQKCVYSQLSHLLCWSLTHTTARVPVSIHSLKGLWVNSLTL